MSDTEGKQAKTYILKGPIFQKYNDLQLNLLDLQFCQRLLKDHADVLTGTASDLQRALWTAILVKYFACFGDSESRRTLNAKKVFKGDDSAKQAFYRLSNVKNKNVVHDVNSSSQSNAVIQVVDGIKSEQFMSMAVVSGINSIDSKNIVALVEHTIAFVSNELYSLGQDAQKIVSGMSLAEIAELPEWSFSAKAAMFDVGEKRVRLD